LAGFILLYDAIHKKTAAGLPVMAGCRALIYPLVGVAGAGASSLPAMLWVASGCMALWVLVLSLLARSKVFRAGPEPSGRDPARGFAVGLASADPAMSAVPGVHSPGAPAAQKHSSRVTMDPIHCSFTISHRYAVHFTRGAFDPSNSLVRDILSGLGSRRILVAVDGGSFPGTRICSARSPRI
jgi:hypothetical protein